MVKEKIYVVGHSKDSTVGRWLGTNLVNSLDEADIVIFHGQTDIHPDLHEYNYKSGTYTYSIKEKDLQETQILLECIKKDKFIVGLNRGLHLIASAEGAKIVQHMQHPAVHDITLYDGQKIKVNSCHHQLIKPFNLPKDTCFILGYAEGISGFYLNGEDSTSILKTHPVGNFSMEIEIAYFPDIKAIGFQYEVHKLPYNSDASKVSRNMVKLMLENKLLGVIKNGVKSSALLEFFMKLTIEEEQKIAKNQTVVEDE